MLTNLFYLFSDNYYHGFLFARGDNMKAMPIYDLNGVLAGVQSAVSTIKMFGVTASVTFFILLCNTCSIFNYKMCIARRTEVIYLSITWIH